MASSINGIVNQPEKQGIGTLALHAGQDPDPSTNSRAILRSWYFQFI